MDNVYPINGRHCTCMFQHLVTKCICSTPATLSIHVTDINLATLLKNHPGNRIEKCKIVLSPSESDVGKEQDVYYGVFCGACKLQARLQAASAQYSESPNENGDETCLPFYKCTGDGGEGYFLCERCVKDGVRKDTGHHVSRLKRLCTWQSYYSSQVKDVWWMDTTSLQGDTGGLGPGLG